MARIRHLCVFSTAALLAGAPLLTAATISGDAFETLVCAATNPGQNKKKAKAAQDAKPQTVVTPVGEVRILDKKEARSLVAKLKKDLLSRRAKSSRKKKGKPATFIARLELVEGLAKVQHESLVPILRKVMTGDPSNAVRIKAAESLLAQPKKPAVKLAAKLIEERDFMTSGSMAAPLIKLLSHHGAPKKTWKFLRRRFLELGTRGQQALLEHIGKSKDWDALELLLAHIDEPRPINVDDPSNPPASYWKKRWEAWRDFKPQLLTALEQLVGKRVESAKAARDYIRSQGGAVKLRKKRGG